MTRIRVRKNGDVGVMCNENHLTFSFEPLNRVYDRLVYEVIVKVVFRLVNDQRVVCPGE